jgi:hypothetical protein
MPIIERARLDEKPRRSTILAHFRATGFRLRGVGRSEISCNEIALSTELGLAKGG